MKHMKIEIIQNKIYNKNLKALERKDIKYF